MFWQFNYLYAIFLWHFSGVAQICLHTCTHKHKRKHTHSTCTHTHSQQTHTLASFISFQSLPLCNCATIIFAPQIHFRLRSFHFECARLCMCVCVCVECVYAQQSPANFVRFIYAHCATALHTSWRSRRTEMNFHGNFIKTNHASPPTIYLPIHLFSLRHQPVPILICVPRTLWPLPPSSPSLGLIEDCRLNCETNVLPHARTRRRGSMAFSIVGHVVWPLFSAPHSGRYLGTRVLSLTVEEEEEAALAKERKTRSAH